MSFREKSAWAMTLVMTLAGVYYLHLITKASAALGASPPPAIVIPYIILIVIASIVAQSSIAISSPAEANAPADERERLVQHRAGNWSGIVLSVCIVTALGHFLAYADGNMLFHLIMGSMMVAQIAEYIFQIALFRLRV
jgi:hypothetical protein